MTKDEKLDALWANVARWDEKTADAIRAANDPTGTEAACEHRQFVVVAAKVERRAALVAYLAAHDYHMLARLDDMALVGLALELEIPRKRLVKTRAA